MQVLLQPRLSFNPSSHVSGGKSFPSPHFGVQTVEVVLVPPMHVKVDKGPVQVLLHPSVLFEPSSHVSGLITSPSPQIVVQVFTVELFVFIDPQLYPAMAPIQVGSHPLPSVGVPSSHVSFPTLFESPQIGMHIVAVVGNPPLQDHPVIVPLHVLLHP